ncbi:hypothetical protein [Mycolicibacterium sp. XJ870]
MAPKGQIAPDQFGEATHWGVWNFLTNAPGWSRIGWEMPNDPSRYYSRDDDVYWTDVRDKARVAYGDPNIGYNTNFPGFDRYLVFGDGTRVPDDGKIVYRDLSDPENVKTWIQYDGGKKVALQGADGEPVGDPKEPAGYHQFNDKWFPVDEHGNQIGPQVAKVPETFRDRQPSENQDKKEPSKNGDPNEPKLTVDLKGMTAPKYPDWAYDPDHGGSQAIPDKLATTLVELYSMLGTGERVPDTFSKFPVDIVTGANLGIDDYDTNSELSNGFSRLRTEYSEFITALNIKVHETKIATQISWKISDDGRRAMNLEIGAFNGKTAVMTVPGDWKSLLDAQAALVNNVENIIKNAVIQPPVLGDPDNPANTNTGVQGLGGGGTDRRTPRTSSLDDGTSTPRDDSTLGKDTDDSSTEDQISRLLSGLSAGLNTDTSTSDSSDGWSSGLSSALSGLSGLSNLSNLGTSLASSARPADSWDRVDNDEKDEDDEKDEAVESLAPPVTPTQGAQAQAVPGQATVVEPQEGTVQPASAVAAPGPGAKLTVTLPDGRVVEAPNAQAAEAARNALADSDGSGDAAQKAYAGTGVEIPSDGKNPGAKVDPSDLQPGDIAKWGDKTMVVVAPGLLAVPGEPDSVITVAEALEQNAREEARGGSSGFVGFYRPTEFDDPTLSSAASPPPLTDPQPTPPVEDNKDTSPPGEPDSPSKSQPAVPPGGDEPAPPASTSDQQSPPPSQDPPVPQQETPPTAPTAPRAETNSLVEPQPAPPSPFAPSPDVPPATRTTKQERIVAGQS